jgi:hypothetical protein
MQHAGDLALARLAQLLDELRTIDGRVERKPGIFCHRGRAFLHFHEDPSGLFADVKLNGFTFERRCVIASDQRQRLVIAVSKALA